MRHHAIVVTGFRREDVDSAHKKAATIFSDKQLTPVVDSYLNGYCSFAIMPDGSKEGWGDSDRGDENRDEFIKFLTGRTGKNLFLDWAEIQFGDEDGDDRILRTNNTPPAGRRSRNEAK